MQKIVMPPPNSAPQLAFFKARSRYLAYGGARGGGKSWAVRWKASLMAAKFAGIRILIIRRTYPELNENHILPMRQMLQGAARYNDSEKAMTFLNGSRIKFGYCKRETDVLQYQGQEYDAIFLDEATQFTEWQFKALDTSVRGVNSFPKRFYLTCNPGGVGHAWVKRLFVDRAFREGENPDDYEFIQARVYDNKSLLEADPGYLDTLKKLPEQKRRAWLDGDWSVVDGAFFPEWDRDVHVVEPFAVPAWWKWYFCIDYGLDMLAAYMAAADDAGNIWITEEVYESGLVIDEAARVCRQMIGGRQLEAAFAPPDLWNRNRDTGRSLAEAFADAGIYLATAQNDRRMGWMEVKRYLQYRTERTADGSVRMAEGPRLRIFDCCENLCESWPYLLCSELDPNDVAKEPHEYTHGPDAVRYLLAGRPQGAEKPVEPDEDERPDEWQEIESFLEFGL